ncbi:restriction endonuclease subunit S (plasmid) [Lactococcus lactis subsp. lactis]|nr:MULTISPECIES: restriction endonuclease subunit S [Lactococcus]AZS27695.2 restriction endonuclease subunit S [Lactococcus lactis subsp. lactis]AZZ79433.1 restriction endonuclease subunit S [Lactococcus lactis subsp. lactis]
MAKIDDSVKKKVPELRFPGFTDDWEERKFADFIDVKSGKDYKHLNSGSIPVYGTGGYMLSVDRALSDIDAIGIGRKGTIDKPYLLKAPFWTVDTLFYAVPKQNIDLQFSLSIFKKINWKKFDESTGVPSLSKTVINSVGASVPSYEEQQKIGSFFKQLDDTIALHQRKLDLLKEQKKGYLQKMFPKNGAKVPELRFAGFTDDWEQRKLGELSQKISVGIATSSSKYFSSQDQGVPFIKNQDIKENRINTKNLEYISKEFDNKNKNKRVKQGDIITARTGYPGLSAVVPKELEGAQTFTTLITRPISEMILSEYISIFINSPYGMKQISGMEAGGAQKNVNAGIVQNLLIPLPSLDEQKKISNFILKLDDTIALHQCKLDLLKEQKKGFLQKMFV